MTKSPFVAVFLSLLMLSGCFGSGDSNDAADEEEIIPVPYSIEASWNEESMMGEIGEITELTIVLVTTGDVSYTHLTLPMTP